MHTGNVLRLVLMLLSAAALMSVGSCMSSSGTSTLTIESSRAVMQPPVRTAVYRMIDPNTADLFFSDFPEDVLVERLRRGREGEPGVILHIHLFLHPKAGQSPIDFTATNTAITYAVFTGGSLGVYGGGGFLLPSTRVGDAALAGTMRGATIRLIEQQGGFTDRLGQAEVSGSLSARRDDELASMISAELTRLLLQ